MKTFAERVGKVIETKLEVDRVNKLLTELCWAVEEFVFELEALEAPPELVKPFQDWLQNIPPEDRFEINLKPLMDSIC